MKMTSEREARNLLQRYGVSCDSVAIWGTGAPQREFMWSLDMADACIFVMEQVDFADLAGNTPEIRNTHINIGSGEEVSIRQLAELVRQTVGFRGELVFDHTKPDGMPRKLTDVTRLHELGWRHQVSLAAGLELFYEWYCKTRAQDSSAQFQVPRCKGSGVRVLECLGGWLPPGLPCKRRASKSK